MCVGVWSVCVGGGGVCVCVGGGGKKNHQTLATYQRTH